VAGFKVISDLGDRIRICVARCSVGLGARNRPDLDNDAVERRVEGLERALHYVQKGITIGKSETPTAKSAQAR
jgi:hypothetical protein